MSLRLYTPQTESNPPVNAEQAELEKLQASAEKLRKEEGLLPADLEALQSHLDRELKKISEPLPALGATAPAATDQDPQTHEFVQLADFVTKELQKKTVSQVPEQRAKIRNIGSYRAIKNNEFEHQFLQKGLQVNKAA